eukprot:gene5757-52063_t
MLMESLRKRRKLRLAELGLSGGSSLFVWEDLFADDAELHSVDMKDVRFRQIIAQLTDEQRARTHLHAANSPITDWTQKEFDWEGTTRSSKILQRESRKGGGFDIIVDDAGHSPLQNMQFFHDLAPHLRPGGLFVFSVHWWGETVIFERSGAPAAPAAVSSDDP